MMKTRLRRESSCPSPFKSPRVLDFNKSTYGFAPLLEHVFKACDFQKLAIRPAVDFLDAMSGSGTLGLAIREKVKAAMADKFHHFAFYFNDVAEAPLAKLRETALIAHRDICDIGTRFPDTFHVVAMQNGIVDLPKERQLQAFRSIYDSMKPGGRLVVADLASLDEQQQSYLSSLHFVSGTSAAAAPRTHEAYIPLMKEWHDLLKSAGFREAELPISEFTIYFSGGTNNTAVRYPAIVLAADKPYPTE